MRILIADDNRESAKKLAVLLDLSGHQTQVAYDPSAAIRSALEYPPDVAVLDLDMPVLDGFSIATFLRAQLPKVLLVGLSDDQGKRALGQAMFDLCFAKGVSFHDFRRHLQDLIRRKQRANPAR